MSTPVKPETLTDEQIHEEAERRGLVGDTRGVTECFEALGRSDICNDITARRGKES